MTILLFYIHGENGGISAIFLASFYTQTHTFIFLQLSQISIFIGTNVDRWKQSSNHFYHCVFFITFACLSFSSFFPPPRFALGKMKDVPSKILKETCSKKWKKNHFCAEKINIDLITHTLWTWKENLWAFLQKVFFLAQNKEKNQRRFLKKRSQCLLFICI